MSDWHDDDLRALAERIADLDPDARAVVELVVARLEGGRPDLAASQKPAPRLRVGDARDDEMRHRETPRPWTDDELRALAAAAAPRELVWSAADFRALAEAAAEALLLTEETS